MLLVDPGTVGARFESGGVSDDSPGPQRARKLPTVSQRLRHDFDEDVESGAALGEGVALRHREVELRERFSAEPPFVQPHHFRARLPVD
jgi:hypothetical protein